MRKIFIAIAAIAGLAGLAACNTAETYKAAPFATLDVRSATVTESAAGTVYALPVHVNNATGDCTVTYAIEDITAKNGLDYTPADASGVLNFPAGTDSLAIKVNVKGQVGTFTGNQAFKISLVSATNDVQIGAIKTCTVTIADPDHPLTALFGKYQMSAVDIASYDSATGRVGYNYFKWDITLSQYEGNPYRVWIDFPVYIASPDAYGAYLKNTAEQPGAYAEVSEDMKTITIPTPQELAYKASDLFNGVPADEHFKIYKYDGGNASASFITEPDQIVFTLQADGSYVTTDNYGICIESATADGWFYYYCNVFGGFNANYPAGFVKK